MQLDDVNFNIVPDSQERKFLYLEGIIRFLELYAKNEIGDVEVDIEKVALWINSPYFENVDLQKIKNIESVYEMLSNDLLNNVPLYRFLKLSDYQYKILEQDHYDNVLADFEIDCNKYACYRCIWYINGVSQIGKYNKCRMPLNNKRGYHKIVNNCKYCCTITDTNWADKFIKDKFLRSRINQDIKTYTNDWIKKVKSLDNSNIPIEIGRINLAEPIDAFSEITRVFNGKKTTSELKNNIRYAMFLEAMIKFVEVYAQTELGSDYEASISKIAKYLVTNKLSFNSEDELYKFLEELDLTHFVERKIL